MNMRTLMALVESQMLNEAPAAGLYMHVTAARNIPSILKSGLVPNHGGGNYSDTRWISLEGVYASKNAGQLVTYLRAHAITHYAVILIEVAAEAALPDEDIMDILIRAAFEHTIEEQGMDEDEAAELGDDDPFWEEVQSVFHEMAKGKGAKPDFLPDLISYWAGQEIQETGVVPDIWMELKDKATRFYLDAPHPTFGYAHSIRIPQSVGFEGPTRIVAIIEVDDRQTKVVFGEVPAGAKAMLGPLVSQTDGQAVAGMSADARRDLLIKRAIAKHPHKTPEAIESRVKALTDAQVTAMLQDAYSE